MKLRLVKSILLLVCVALLGCGGRAASNQKGEDEGVGENQKGEGEGAGESEVPELPPSVDSNEGEGLGTEGESDGSQGSGDPIPPDDEPDPTYAPGTEPTDEEPEPPVDDGSGWVQQGDMGGNLMITCNDCIEAGCGDVSNTCRDTDGCQSGIQCVGGECGGKASSECTTQCFGDDADMSLLAFQALACVLGECGQSCISAL